ncbi:poly(ADP-ribose) glycohydrolase arh3-like [Plakobranchus ocellatus]|uniref:ADP-ribosylhydrolase ARH3 n=1 Tax=Plakobranchus ocellatus TaxID=259542 RepID=A0AAV4BGE3_9GAST|nr:poly(ADP-ribose) glycohydrolase arh3-like [Plakobranchus ocellatus]
MSLSRFKACLVGAVLGDCIGALYECMSVVPLSTVLEYTSTLETNRKIQREHGTRPADFYGLRYTDDTAMTRSVAASLLEKKTFDAQDMARRFSQEYFEEPNRGYGGSVITVFESLKNPDLEDVYEPARTQFEGSGSYGNGGAMRIAPAPLFTLKKHKTEDLQDLVSSVTRLTHTNVLGVHGAILQALAIDQSLRLSSASDLDACAFIDSLVEKMRLIETRDKDASPKPSPAKIPKRKLDAHPTPYTAKLEKMKEFFQKDSFETSEIVKEMG